MEYNIVIRSEKKVKQSMISAALEKAGVEVASFEEHKNLFGVF